MSGVSVRAVRYEVSVLPVDFEDGELWTITVEYRGAGLWAVLHGGHALGTDGQWDYEPRPSDREDDWKAAHRFTLAEAVGKATELASRLTANTAFGPMTAQDAMKLKEKRERP